MKKRTNKKIIIFVSYLSIISLFFYFGLRIYVYYAQSVGVFNSGFGVILIFAEAHSVIQSLGFLSNIIRLRKPGVNYNRKAKLNEKNLPSVTVLVPARNEPLEILEKTFICLKSLDYNNKNIIFLDGSDSERLKENAQLAKKYDITHFVPKTTPKSKAEIVNIALKEIKTEYLSIFDADQNPMPSFLKETMALIEYSKKIAFIQTPQLYTNIANSPIAKAAALQQSIFYENICEGKGSSNSMFCCGTNFLMRTNVLKEVGGFDEKSVTEDFATSVKIHSLGYKSIYYNHVRVFGMAPENLAAYFKQQYRWSAGTVGVVRKLLSETLNGRLKLNLKQIWEYFLSATYYFTGWSFFFLIMSPALYLLFSVPSYFAKPIFYLGSFLPYYILTTTVFYATMKNRNYKIKDVFTGNIMSSLNFPILMQSTISALLNKKLSFQITDKGPGKTLPFLALWPWTIVIAFNLLAFANGFFRFTENPYAIGVNMFWCFYHVILIANIYRFNESVIK